jgi:hypothetical protein
VHGLRIGGRLIQIDSQGSPAAHALEAGIRSLLRRGRLKRKGGNDCRNNEFHSLPPGKVGRLTGIDDDLTFFYDHFGL